MSDQENFENNNVTLKLSTGTESKLITITHPVSDTGTVLPMLLIQFTHI